jgi:O-antigen/teichoic acid export membrane protein
VVIGNLILLFDSWLVGWWYRDEAVFAVFRYGAREFPLVQALAGALGVAIIPRLIEDFPAGLADLRAMSRKLFHLLFPSAILLLFVAKPLFPVVFNPDFAAAAPLFNIYLLMTASRLLLPNSIVLAKSEPRVILWIGLTEFAAKVVFGVLGIHFGGLVGLAWSAVLAFWVEKILLIIYLKKQHGLALRDWLDARLFGAYGLLLLAAYIGSLYL